MIFNYLDNRYQDRGDNSQRNFGSRNFNERGPDQSSGDTLIQRDTIFVQNLPKNVSVEELEEKFGSIGKIKIDKKTNASKIWIYKDKNTGDGKGECTITYEDEAAAEAAIQWFNEKVIMGNVVKIQLATRKNNFNNFRGGSRGGRGGGGGGGSGGGRYEGGGGRYDGGSGSGRYGSGSGDGGNRGNRDNYSNRNYSNRGSGGNDRYSR